MVNAESYGINPKDELELLALTSKPEKASNDKRINEVFSKHFFETNFWQMWKTLFAFEPWHSAIEMRRYLLRFMHLFPDMRNSKDCSTTPGITSTIRWCARSSSG